LAQHKCAISAVEFAAGKDSRNPISELEMRDAAEHSERFRLMLEFIEQLKTVDYTPVLLAGAIPEELP